VAAKFQLDTGTLFYDKLDFQGRIIERIEKFYPIPPTPECNQTTYGQFIQSLSAQSITPLVQQNLTNDQPLQCCDFYENGTGYQFTICDQNIGVYILGDRKGSEVDLRYLNVPMNMVGFNDIPWSELEAVIDQ
jgi:hypothetical protein